MQRSFKVKMITYVCIAFMILFSIYSYMVDDNANEKVNRLNIDLTNQIIDARANQISNWIEQRKIELSMVADFIISYEMNDNEAIEYIESVFQQKNDIYLDMGIVKYGGYKQTYEDKKGESISDQPYYKNALKENAKFKVSGPIEKDGKKVVVMLNKVGGVNREIEFLYAEVPLEELMRIASRINVYDGIGEILINNSSLIDGRMVQNALLGDDNLIFETDISSARGWSLNYYIPGKNIKQISYDMRSSIIIFAIILLLTMVVLLFISFSSIFKPIDKLKELMKKVEDGDLSVRMENNRNDEIGSLVTGFNNMTEKLEKLSYQEKEMKLQIMQEQIKPHFLYNTLDTIKWVAMEDDTEEILSLIDSLSTYFRIGLSSGKKFITLDEELEHIDSYLRIQKARFVDRLSYSIHYDDDLTQCMVMRVLLQPIVENAVVHGVNKMIDSRNK